jgi:hypothetical protein
MEWMDLAQESDRRRAVVDAVMNLPIAKNAGISSTS